LLNAGDQAVVDLLAVAATVSSISLAAAGTRRAGWLTALRSVPVLTSLTLAVLVLAEADALFTGNSQLALLLIADALALWFALTVRGELLDARLIRLGRQRASHRTRRRSFINNRDTQRHTDTQSRPCAAAVNPLPGRRHGRRPL